MQGVCNFYTIMITGISSAIIMIQLLGINVFFTFVIKLYKKEITVKTNHDSNFFLRPFSFGDSSYC